jgi:hypothetical protein
LATAWCGCGIDLGYGLARAVGLVVFSNSALWRYQQLKQNPHSSAAQLMRILPATREKAC